MDFASSTGLIFDCDGTLADTMPLHFIAWRTTLSRHGISFPEDLFYSMAGQPTELIVEKLLVAQNLTGDPVAIAHEKELEFLETLDDVQPIQAIVDIAQRHRATHPMGVGSGSSRDTVLRILKNIGLENFFDAIVGAEDTERHKPEPDVFLEVAHRIGAEPAGCCVFEDADLGVEAAQRAGMTCFDVRSIFLPQRVTSG